MRKLRMTVLGVCVALSAQAAEKGERWQYTMQMKGDLPGGFQLPAMNMRVCQPPGWREPPKGQDQSDCQVKNYTRSGDTYTWEMACPRMTGRGQMTLHGSDRFSGRFEAETEGHKMAMDMSGSKLAGDCDPETEKMSLNDHQLPSKQEMEKLAADLQKQAAAMEKTVPEATAVDCAAALSQRQLEILSASCPAEKQVLVVEVCKGKDTAAQYAQFCGVPAPSEKDKAVKEGLKKLKDLIRW